MLNQCQSDVMNWIKLKLQKRELLLKDSLSIQVSRIHSVLNEVAFPLKDQLYYLEMPMDSFLMLEAQVVSMAQCTFH